MHPKPRYQFDYKKVKGLNDQEVSERLARDGYNQLGSSKSAGLLGTIAGVLREPMFFLLVFCSSLYFWLGESTEAIALMLSVVLIVLIEIYQENKTEKALEALKDLSSPRALVIRNGQPQRIPGKEVVVDDILVLSEGDRVPADALMVSSNNLQVDESILTGESLAVSKVADASLGAMQAPGSDSSFSVYASTLIVGGHGLARVAAIGQATEVGKIGKTLSEVTPERTKLQLEVDNLVKTVAMYGALICLAIVGIYGFTREDWLGGFLAGISLAMSILPQEFPVIFAIFVALGAWRLSRFNVLASNQKTIQTLGSITVLCVDKTGTLTQNKMELRALDNGDGLWHNDEKTRIGSDFHNLLDLSVLASQDKPFDPLEIALKQEHDRIVKSQTKRWQGWEMIEEYPLSSELLAVSHVWRIPDNNHYLIAAKGAPEAVFDLCHLNKTDQVAWLERVNTLAANGLRVLAVAKAESPNSSLPKKQHDFEFQLVGLLGFGDPVRPGVDTAVAECYRAGIKVVMITGDYPATAQKIGHEIGLDPDSCILTGQELATLTDEHLKELVPSVNIFARISPEQKLRIVQAFKQAGEIVAMTGDGVNDAPALKTAQAGIAMGMRGTDVAREAADIVLLDDNFTSIINGIKLGRRIFDNIRKAIYYVLAIHTPIAGITFLSVIAGWPLLLLPIHLALLELIVDPTCSIAFENEPAEKDIMARPPRKPETKMFTWPMFRLAAIQGTSVLAALVLSYQWGTAAGYGLEQVRAMVFTTLIFANLFLILANRSWSHSLWQTFKHRNRTVWLVIGFSLTFLAVALFTPWISHLFHFARPHWLYLFGCALIGTASVVFLEFLENGLDQSSKKTI